MDFKVAKALTKAFLDNLDVYRKKAPFMRFTGVGETDPALTGMCGPNRSITTPARWRRGRRPDTSSPTARSRSLGAPA